MSAALEIALNPSALPLDLNWKHRIFAEIRHIDSDHFCNLPANLCKMQTDQHEAETATECTCKSLHASIAPRASLRSSRRSQSGSEARRHAKGIHSPLFEPVFAPLLQVDWVERLEATLRPGTIIVYELE